MKLITEMKKLISQLKSGQQIILSSLKDEKEVQHLTFIEYTDDTFKLFTATPKKKGGYTIEKEEELTANQTAQKLKSLIKGEEQPQQRTPIEELEKLVNNQKDAINHSLQFKKNRQTQLKMIDDFKAQIEAKRAKLAKEEAEKKAVN